MHTPITIEQARNLYRTRTNAIAYTAFNGTQVIVFESDRKIIQVNDFGYRKEAFTQPRNQLIDSLFNFLMEEDDAEML